MDLPYFLNIAEEEILIMKFVEKIIVATSDKEKSQLKKLLSYAKQNGLKGVKLWNREQIIEREPYCQGLEVLFVP